jgi:hypothetical protein
LVVEKMVWGWRPWGRRRYDVKKLRVPLVSGTHGAVMRSAMLENGMAQPPFGLKLPV